MFINKPLFLWRMVSYLIMQILFFPNIAMTQSNLDFAHDSKTYDLGLLGNTSLAFVPAAYISPENSLHVGFSHIPKQAAFITYSQDNEVGEHVKYVNLGYLSFLEITLRLTKPYGTKNTFGIGDRSYFVKIQALKERKFLPAVAIGFHDMLTLATHFHSAYVVASKRFEWTEKQWSIQSHLGYGTKVQETENNYLIGVFGGVELKWKFLTILTEYDAKNIHTGIKINIKNLVFLQATLLNMKQIGAGLNVKFTL